MKFGVVLFGMILFLISPLSAAAEQRPGPEATQHALDELANAVAQGRITLTPTPTPTLTPTPIPTATATVTEVVPTVIMSPTATPVPVLPVATGDDPIQGYLRPTDSWIELAIPQGRWFVYSDTCDLQAWNTVWLWNNGQDTYLNDCHIDTSVWSSTTPCAQNDDGICDIQLDQSYWDYLGSLPTPTETPVPSPTLLTHINVLSTVPPVRQTEPVVQPTLPP
ncbi:MAG TPA: hypothetical protein VFK47_04355, partial [Ktedonobacteraceae bacterium]|nr:hypothetical protein [Ktedonobacteraceae bacterium]